MMMDGKVVVVPIEYGVTLLSREGEQVVGTTDSLRWRSWDDAARFGEREVAEGHADGFRVFYEAAV